MQFHVSFVVTALAMIASVVAQGVTEKISPPGSPPAGCKTTFDGRFEITALVVTDLSKRDLHGPIEKRAECGAEGVLVMSLKEAVTKDALSRTGYIASNYQFQFDEPAQAGALYTAGWSLCEDGNLALGNSTIFYQCQSGHFGNLYDRNWAKQCSPVVLKAIVCGVGAGAMDPGHVVATNVVTTTIVRPLSDGQPQAITTVVPIAMCQIDDGQIQAHATPCASVPAPAESATPISQITDGQIQVPPASGEPAPPPPATTAPGVLPPAPTGGNATSSGVVPSTEPSTSQPTTPATSPSTPPTAAAGRLNHMGRSVLLAGGVGLVAAVFL